MGAEKANNEDSKIGKVSIPSLDVKLLGVTSYAEWTTSLKLFLRMIPVNKKRVWHIVNGEYPKPNPGDNWGDKKFTEDDGIAWEDRKPLAVLTVRKNCCDEIKSRFGVLELASDIWKELKKSI
jgi:hypothetical protein